MVLIETLSLRATNITLRLSLEVMRRAAEPASAGMMLCRIQVPVFSFQPLRRGHGWNDRHRDYCDFGGHGTRGHGGFCDIPHGHPFNRLQSGLADARRRCGAAEPKSVS